MPLDHWLAFVAASAVLLAIPGPTVVLIISYALGHGRRAASSTVAGVALGDFTAMTASLLGLGALLAASATLFMVLKWAGAAYLIYLGVKLWRAPVAEQVADVVVPVERHGRIFLHAYAVTALNPKSIVFFIAFLPQFLDRSGPVPGTVADLRGHVPCAGDTECTGLCAAGVRGAPHHSAAGRAAGGQPGRRRFADRSRDPGGGVAAVDVRGRSELVAGDRDSVTTRRSLAQAAGRRRPTSMRCVARAMKLGLCIHRASSCASRFRNWGSAPIVAGCQRASGLNLPWKMSRPHRSSISKCSAKQRRSSSDVNRWNCKTMRRPSWNSTSQRSR